MEEHTDSVAASEFVGVRSFRVEAFIGRRVAGWPFSRFDISSSELRVRLSFPWFISRSQQATAIRAVIVKRRLDRYWIGFDDAAGNLSDARVHPIYRYQQVIGELRRCGYNVVGDTSRGAQASRWRWRSS
jgi:hypothetical protein